MTEASQKKKVYIACDHGGFELKNFLISQIDDVEWVDFGTGSPESVDYPDYADKVVKEVLDSSDFGVLICGTGQGMAMRANRYPGIRACLSWSEEIAFLGRSHNNANILSLPGRFVEPLDALAMVNVFLNTPFEGGRHEKRVSKIESPTKF